MSRHWAPPPRRGEAHSDRFGPPQGTLQQCAMRALSSARVHTPLENLHNCPRSSFPNGSPGDDTTTGIDGRKKYWQKVLKPRAEQGRKSLVCKHEETENRGNKSYSAKLPQKARTWATLEGKSAGRQHC